MLFTVLFYVFAGLLAVGGVGLGGVTLYRMLPQRATVAKRTLPSSADYSVEEEEFRNWIEMRDAIDASNVAARKAHNDVLLALFGQVPAQPPAPKADANAPKST